MVSIPSPPVLPVPAYLRLHEAFLPQEAQVKASIQQGTWLGLTHGIALGTHAYQSLVNDRLLTYESPGLWQTFDIRVGCQFLQMSQERLSTALWAAYRSSRYLDSDFNQVQSSGIVLSLQHAYQVQPFYLQGAFIQLYQDEESLRDKGNGPKALKVFYKQKRALPMVRVSLPADIQFNQVRYPTQWPYLGLTQPIALSLRIDPSFSTTVFRLLNNAREDAWSMAFYGIGSYASIAKNTDISGQYAFKIALGLQGTFYYSDALKTSSTSLNPVVDGVVTYQF